MRNPMRGTMWFIADHNAKAGQMSFETHLSRAAQAFQAKHGSPPTTCLVHESEFDSRPSEVDGITIMPARNIRPHYILVGVES